MTPKEALKAAEKQLQAMKAMKTKYVAVGVLANEATGRVYQNGVNVLQVAAIHEYGLGNPERSFLKMPQELKQKDIKSFINLQLNKVFEGMQVEKGLGLIGSYVVGISQDAFATEGFGNWPKLSPITVELKRRGGAKSGRDVGDAAKAAKSAFFEPERSGENKILTDKGILKSSVNYEVR